MEKVKEYGIQALTTGVTGFCLTKALANSASNGSIGSGMNFATAIGTSAAVGSVAAQVAHDYILPHIPQDKRFVSVETAALNAAASGAGALAAIYFMDPRVAMGNPLTIAGLAVGSEVIGNYAADQFVKPLIMKYTANV